MAFEHWMSLRICSCIFMWPMKIVKCSDWLQDLVRAAVASSKGHLFRGFKDFWPSSVPPAATQGRGRPSPGSFFRKLGYLSQGSLESRILFFWGKVPNALRLPPP